MYTCIITKFEILGGEIIMTKKENEKLLIEAEKRAEKMSLEDPNFFYYVIKFSF